MTFHIFKKKSVIAFLLVTAVFVFVSYLSKEFSQEIKNYLSTDGRANEAIYILITVIEVVFAPLSTLPLLPVAVVLWGVNLAAIYTVIGWQIGAMIAFLIARRFGKKVVGKFIDLDHIKEYTDYVPKKNIFLMIVLIRVFLPVDILSYAIGIFTNANWLVYSVATFIGIVPFAYIFTYAATFSFFTQIVGIAVFFLIFAYGHAKVRNNFLHK